MKQIGNKALESLRIEKGYGIWSTEFTAEYSPAMCGLDKFIDFNKGDFIGRDAALREANSPPARRLVQLTVDAVDADAKMLDPIYLDNKWIGFVTSGAYCHYSGLSIALGYVDADVAMLGATAGPLLIRIVGEPRAARILDAVPYDPQGKRLRI